MIKREPREPFWNCIPNLHVLKIFGNYQLSYSLHNTNEKGTKNSVSYYVIITANDNTHDVSWSQKKSWIMHKCSSTNSPFMLRIWKHLLKTAAKKHGRATLHKPRNLECSVAPSSQEIFAEKEGKRAWQLWWLSEQHLRPCALIASCPARLERLSPASISCTAGS